MQSLLIGQIAPGCLVLLFSCQRHSVSHGQGLNSSRAEGTGLLMEALCSLVTFTAPLETSWWPIRWALWVGATTVPLSLSTKSFCHRTRLQFSTFVISLTYFPRGVYFFFIVLFMVSTGKMSLTVMSQHVNRENGRKNIALLCVQTCEQWCIVGASRYASAEHWLNALFFKHSFMWMPEFSAYPLPEVDLNTSCLTFYEVNIKVALATCISPTG